jgi:hypothetical protein
MTTIHSASDQGFITDNADLPAPDTTSAPLSAGPVGTVTSPKPLPCVNDSGRISFGAGFRFPLQK